MRLVPPSRMKQIAGRAGRFGFGSSQGIVTCLHDQDMEYLRDCMNTPNDNYTHAGIAPPATLIEELSYQYKDLSLVAMLGAITDAGRYGKCFTPSISQEQKIIVHLLCSFPALSIAEKLLLSAAPVNLRDSGTVNAFHWFITCIADKRPCPLRVSLAHHRQALDYLSMAESFYRTLDLYLWLAFRFPEIFTEQDQVLEKREQCNRLVTKLLSQITVHKTGRLDFGDADGQGPDLGDYQKSPLVETANADLDTLDRVLQDIDQKTKSS